MTKFELLFVLLVLMIAGTPAFAAMESAGCGGVESVMSSGASDFSRNPALMVLSDKSLNIGFAGSYTFASNTENDIEVGNLLSFEKAVAENEQKEYLAVKGSGGIVLGNGVFAFGIGINSGGDALLEAEKNTSKIDFYNFGSTTPNYIENEEEKKTIWRPGTSTGVSWKINDNFSLGLSGAYQHVLTERTVKKTSNGVTPGNITDYNYKQTEKIFSGKTGIVYSNQYAEVGVFIIPVKYTSFSQDIDIRYEDIATAQVKETSFGFSDNMVRTSNPEICIGVSNKINDSIRLNIEIDYQFKNRYNIDGKYYDNVSQNVLEYTLVNRQSPRVSIRGGFVVDVNESVTIGLGGGYISTLLMQEKTEQAEEMETSIRAGYGTCSMDYLLGEGVSVGFAVNFVSVHMRSAGYVNGPKINADTDRLQAEGMLGINLAI